MKNNISKSLASFLLSSAMFAEVPTVGSPVLVPDVAQNQKLANINIEQSVPNKTRETIFVKDFNFVGNEGLDKNELMVNIKKYLRTNMSISDINKACELVTKTYYDKGYSSAIATVVPNSYKDKILTITITKSKTGKVDFKQTVLVGLTLDEICGDLPSVKSNITEEKVIEKQTLPDANITATQNKPTQTIYIKDFKFVGNESLDKKELMANIKQYVKKDVSINDIEKICELVTQTYQDKGYFLSQAYIAPNSYNNEVLTITITKAKYGKFSVKNSSLVTTKSIEDIFSGLKDKDVMADSIQRAVMLTSDLSGLTFKGIRTLPGKDENTTDFEIVADRASRFDGYLMADNYGSVYNGLYRFSLGANANSPLGIGDKLSITAMATDGYGAKNGSINYQSPVGSDGLTIGGGYYNNQYTLGGIYSNLNALGNTSALQLNFTYPLIKLYSESLNVSFNPQMQLVKDLQLSDNNQRKIGLGVFGLDYSKNFNALNLGNSFKTNASYTVGKLTFVDSQDATQDSLTTNTQGVFSKLSYSGSLATALSSELSLKNSFNAQFALAKKNLDPSQDITIGGAYAVRAFPTTQESGDSGYIYTAELEHALPSAQPYWHSASIFYDVGRSFMTNPNSPSGYIPFNSQILQDVGIGYSCGYKSLFAKFQLAQVVGGVKVQGVSYYTTKGLFQVGVFW